MTRPHPQPQLDLGYGWIWTYGHLIPAAALSAAAIASASLGGPRWLSLASATLALWAVAGFLVMRFVVRMDELGPLPTDDFAPGETRILDLGCGAGRTSLIVAQERPASRIVALDNFSADYIRGHGEQNTRSNLRAAGVDDRVEIHSGDMRQIPFPNESFDCVVSSAAIDHLDPSDIPVALAEANRVLREAGQVLLWLIVPNLWSGIAFGPMMWLHTSFATRRDWREMLSESGFEIDAEGTMRGLAWILATRAREPSAARAPDVPTRRAIPRHVLWLSGALVVGGSLLRLEGFAAAGLWIAGAGVVAVHLGAAFFGLSALRGWLERRRSSRA